MGFLGIGNYSKPGKGVSKDDTQEKKRIFLFFEIFFRKFWKLIQINLLFVLCCIPIVTIGPATAGLTYVLRNYSKEEHAFLLSDFWDAVKNNWKQSVPTGILSIIVGIVIYYSASFYYSNIASNSIFIVLFGITIALAITMLFASYYVYLLIITVDLKLLQVYKNAFILAVLGLKTNIITTFFLALIIIPVILFFPISLLFVILIVPAFIGLMICFNSYQYIKKFCIDPYYNKLQEENQDQTIAKKDDSVFTDTTPNRNKD